MFKSCAACCFFPVFFVVICLVISWTSVTWVDLGEEWLYRRDGFSENLPATFSIQNEKFMEQNHPDIFKAEHKQEKSERDWFQAALFITL